MARETGGLQAGVPARGMLAPTVPRARRAGGPAVIHRISTPTYPRVLEHSQTLNAKIHLDKPREALKPLQSGG